MAISDPIADMLTRIRNANMVGHKSVEIPASNMKVKIARILEDEGFVSGVDLENEGTKDAVIKFNLQYWGKNDPVITGLKRISKPGLREYVSNKNIPVIKGGLGISIVSTNKGLMTDQEAREAGIGGEVICSVF